MVSAAIYVLYDVTTFDTRSVTVGSLLNSQSRERIIIPPFQRGYEWKQKQVENFWSDFQRFQRGKDMENGPVAYFLGPIVILEKPKKDIELLDGQQRLATITILFSVIRDLAASLPGQAGKDYANDTQKQMILKEDGQRIMTLSETDDDVFRDAIQTSPAVPLTGKRLRTHKNILAAQAFFKTELEKLTSGSNPTATLDLLKGIRRTLCADLKLACIPVDSDRDAIIIFETLNNRGLRLAVPDLFLCYLMRKVEDRAKRDTLRELWTKIVECMGAYDIDRFIRHYWVSRFGDLKDVDLITELETFIESGDTNPIDFVRTCASECESYVALLDADEKTLKESAKHVKNLLGDLQCKACLPMLLSAYQSLELADFSKVCQWIIVFVVRYSTISKLDPSGRETIFFQLAKTIRKNESEGVSKKTTLTTIRETLEKNGPLPAEVSSKITALLLNHGESRYMVRAIANYMQSPAKDVKVDESNVEHIYPQGPEPNEWGGRDNQEVMNELLWNIGNLTIYGKRANNKASNREYSVKRPDYLSKSKVQMTLALAGRYEEWTAQTILDRATALAPSIGVIWDYANTSRV